MLRISMRLCPEKLRFSMQSFVKPNLVEKVRRLPKQQIELFYDDYCDVFCDAYVDGIIQVIL